VRIKLVAASAGTGKTYRLGNELLEAVRAGMPPQWVLATTFTNRAAAELLARGRRRLLDAGLPNAALNLMLARVGTVNAVFGGLLGDFALQSGRSPVVSVIPDSARSQVFRVAADSVVQQHAPALAALAERFGFFQAQADWQDMLTELIGVARANGIAAADLQASADRSVRSLLAALPAPGKADGDLNKALLAAARQAIEDISRSVDTTKKTADALADLKEVTDRFEAGRASWADWARLSKLEAAKLADRFLEPVRAAAAQHPRHPRLREDIELFIRTMFIAAAESMASVQQYKRTQGLVDFVDQEADALDLLADEAAARRIAARTKVLLVDEFQDTSPIQLALFLRLAGLVEQTLFVGDTKQAIYGFRGADPDLVDAVARSLAGKAGVTTETLPTNRRSRPAIVQLVNMVFGLALPPLGIPVNQVVVQPHRTDIARQAPALALWRVAGNNKGIAAQALAQRVARVLRERDRWRVQPSGEADLRPIRGGDIAILVRSNDTAVTIADALASAGLRVALARDGLLSRAETVLAIAGLRYLADDTDSLALAEIAHILEGASEAPSWLSTVLTSADRVAALRSAPFARLLTAERDRLAALTPAEALDRSISVLDLHGILPAWGDPAARHANLAALRALARDYEAACQSTRVPATASGLAAWLQAQHAEQPASPDPDAVHVLTCHRSKGLEWPMVILADMENPGEARLFNKPVAMPRDGGFDPDDPLAGRWIRLWPWPYGGQRKGVGLDVSAPAVPEGVAAGAAAKGEAARLLYVAMTRARDYLVLAPRLKTATSLLTSWLDLLPGSPKPLILPATDADVQAGGAVVEMAVEDLVAIETESPPATQAVGSVLPADGAPLFPPRRVKPSAAPAGSCPPAWRAITIGERLPLQGAADMTALGEALHGFFVADRPAADGGWRIARAERLLTAWAVSALHAEDVVTAADRLWAHLDEAYPGGIWRREWPVVQVHEGQTLSGRIDLVVEHRGALAVYDHKSFPGGRDRWPDEVAAYAPQLQTYAAALCAATGLAVVRTAIHLPVAGTMLVLEVDR
jgi:ATP-dependent helicase/nuclease subunit A